MNRTVIDLLADNADHAGRFADRFDAVQDAQHPEAVTVCCSDSRVLADHAWGNDEPGRLFSCRNIGNRVVQRTEAGEVVSGDVLYPLVELGTEVAVVVGHTGCGAVTAAYRALTEGLEAPPGIAHCVNLLAAHLEPALANLPGGLETDVAVNRLVEANVDRQVAHLLGSEYVPETVDIVGVVYDFQDVYGGRRGEVHVVNVDGERDPDALRDTYPEIGPRVRRLATD